MTSVAGSSTAVREASARLFDRCLGRFPCLADRATRSSLCLKFILVLLHVILAGALFLLDTELRRRTREHPWYTAIYMVLFLSTLFQYFFTSYSSPGYVVDALMARSGTPLPLQARQASIQIIPIYGNASSSTQMTSAWLKQVMDLYPPGFSSRSWTCSYCHIMQPPRSKHCHDCDRCVLKFDHHCPWLGTCIGKGNHCRFWWYIFEETILCMWTGTLYIDLLMSKEMKACYLALTNQSTHEIMRRRRILYFRGVPRKVHPFSRGICRNLIAFCCSYGDIYALEAVPPMEELEARARPYTCTDIISWRC